MIRNIPDLDLDSFSKEDIKDLKIPELTQMFSNYDDSLMQELAYLSFLSKCPWGIEFNINRGIQRIIFDLNLPLYEGEGVSWKETQLSPSSIYASQDSVQEDVLNMVRAAFNYMNLCKKPIPPVAVWYNRNDNHHRYVAHDGHHRIIVCHEMGIPVPTILMEYWLDNPEDPILNKRMMFDELDTLCINLPIA